MFTILANASEEGGGVQINLGVIAVILVAVILAIVYWRRRRHPAGPRH